MSSGAPGPSNPAGATLPAGTVVAPPIGTSPTPRSTEIEDDPFVKAGFDKAPEKVDTTKGKPAEPKEKPAKPEVKTEKAPEGKTEKPVEGEKQTPKTGWQRFREAEKQLQAEKSRIKAMETELAKFKSGAPNDFKIDEHPEFKQTREKLTTTEKRAQELEERIRFVDYESSQEYKDKYHAPYVETWKQAIAQISQFTLQDGDQTRKATVEDLSKIVAITNPEQALAKAEEMFGSPTKAAYAMAMRDRILDANAKAEQAKIEFRTKGIDERKKMEAQSEREMTERATQFTTKTQEAVEKYPQWFAPVEGDDEGNAILERGMMLADAAFGGQIKDPQTGEKRDPTPDEMVTINASLRNKAAGFDRIVRNNAKLQKQIDDLNAELEAYKGTEPGEGEVGKVGKTVDDDDTPLLLRG